MPYADLVLEGGGVKGIALVGALTVLEERGYTFKRVAGTSAGAIVGALVAAGCPATQLVDIMRTVDYARFQDGTRLERFVLGKAVGLVFRQGIYRGEYLRQWLGEQLERRDVRTFADLAYQDQERPLPPAKAFRLVVMTSDISAGCLRRLPWHYDQYQREASSQPVVDAVRASMSIPFFYRPVKWTTTGREKSWLVDGGMLSNFPIDTFDAPAGVQPRWPTLGIKLSARPTEAQGRTQRVSGTVSMGLAMVSTMTGFYDKMHLEGSDAVDRTIFVDTGDVKATDFHLSRSQQDALFESGRLAATKFLDGGGGRPAWDFDEYVARHRDVDAPAAGVGE